MKTTNIIAETIDRLPQGYVFTYADFLEKVESKEALSKALNRMVSAGKIAKLSKGKFYKPERTVFGNLEPDIYQIVKNLLERDGKIEGYLTGLSIYSKLGLTTQISSTIQIGKNQTRPSFKRGKYTISFIRQKNTITRETIPFLQILDAIRYIKKIPNTTELEALQLIQKLISLKSMKEREIMVRLALKYPPATRASLGCILDEIDPKNVSSKLKSSLNPLTIFKISDASKIFKFAKDWNIQ